MVRKKRGLVIFFILSCIILVSFVSASDVAYILQNKRNVKQNVLDVFSEFGMTADIIEDKNIAKYNLANYKLVFIDDAILRKTGKLAIYNYPSVIMNQNYGPEWGLTDSDGVSQLASTAPLSVKLEDNGIKQVYTKAKYSAGGISIPYFYLDDLNKPDPSVSIARTYTGGEYEFGDVVSVIPKGAKLNGGITTKGKLCFYGIAKTRYWTANARNLFKDCVGRVLSKCSHDIECGTDGFIGNKYCVNGDLYQDYRDFSCINPDTIGSYCINNTQQRLLEPCVYGCSNGACKQPEHDTGFEENYDGLSNRIRIRNLSNSNVPDVVFINEGGYDIQFKIVNRGNFQENISLNCSISNKTASYYSWNKAASLDIDGSYSTGGKDNFDFPMGNGGYNISCTINPSDANPADNFATRKIIVNKSLPQCIINSDCGQEVIGENYCIGKNVSRNHTTPICTLGRCSTAFSIETVQICSDLCQNGACVNIICHNDTECDDADEYTIDKCVNPGRIDSFCTHERITCLFDSDCGTNGFIDGLYCNGAFNKDLYQNYREWECENNGTISSSCSQTISQRLVTPCADACVNSSCIDFVCENDADCNDGNNQTADICEMPGTINSRCIHENGDCNRNSDCGVNRFIGGLYCREDSIYRDFQNFKCNNPLTLSSFCSNSINSTFLFECQYACANGFCVRCNENLDCDDNDTGTEDICWFSGTIDAFCTHEHIECFENRDCGNDGFISGLYCFNSSVAQDYRTFSCRNPGTPGSFCRADVEKIINESCPFGCQDGECREPECRQDSDCGEIRYGNNYCVLNEIWRVKFMPECEEFSCRIVNTTEFVDSCAFGCENGRCLEGRHDIGFVEDYDGFGHFIELHDPNNAIIPEDTPQLICNQLYDLHFLTKNFGEFIENVSINVSIINSTNAVYSDVKIKTNLAINGTTTTGNKNNLNMSFSSGDYIILINASMQGFEDPTPEDNFASRNIEIICPECEDEEIENRSCGHNNIGECRLGIQERICENGEWGSWGRCIGAILPEPEICDGFDNDCDGLIDEDNVCGNISCYDNEDCGRDRWIGDPLCIRGDVWQNFKVFRCIFPGTSSSYCTDQIDLILKKDCGQESYSERYCKDNNVYRDKFMPECDDGECEVRNITELVQECECGCNNGQCVPTQKIWQALTAYEDVASPASKTWIINQNLSGIWVNNIYYSFGVYNLMINSGQGNLGPFSCAYKCSDPQWNFTSRFVSTLSLQWTDDNHGANARVLGLIDGCGCKQENCETCIPKERFSSSTSLSNIKFTNLASSFDQATSQYVEHVQVQNLGSNTQTMEYLKFACRCYQKAGNRDGGACIAYWPSSNADCMMVAENLTLAIGETRIIDLPVSQYQNKLCGTFQTDLLIKKINSKTYTGEYGGVIVAWALAHLCRDCEV